MAGSHAGLLLICGTVNERRFEHANNPPFDCADAVILVPFGRRSYLPAIVERCGGEELALDETTDRIAYRLMSHDVTLLYSGMGGPAAANALEMAAANGARRVVLFGACGGVDPGLGVGHLLAVSAAVRGEGTSDYYAPRGFPAAFDPVLTWRLLEEANGTGVETRLGVTFTTDAGYRQGPEIYEDCAGLVVGVESECASAAVVGARLGLSMGALLFCTDNVRLSRRADQQYGGLRDPRVRRAFVAGIDSVLRVLRPGG
jgi:uridine phosphorylase